MKEVMRLAITQRARCMLRQGNFAVQSQSTEPAAIMGRTAKPVAGNHLQWKAAKPAR
jgi:hypothetical protein